MFLFVILILMKFNKIYPYNIYLNTQSVLTNRYKAKRAQKELSTFRFGIEAPEDTIFVFDEETMEEWRDSGLHFYDLTGTIVGIPGEIEWEEI